MLLTVIPSWKNSHFQIRIMKREGSNAQLYIFLVELTCETLRFDTLSTEKEQLSDRGSSDGCCMYRLNSLQPLFLKLFS